MNWKKLFGFRFQNEFRSEEELGKSKSFVPPMDDGSLTINTGVSSYTNIYYNPAILKDEAEIITKYREMSLHSEVANAINHILSDFLVTDMMKPPVDVVINDPEERLSENIKNKIFAEFKEILRLLNFSNTAYRHVYRWYVDGRYHLHCIIDPEHPSKGIIELRYIDPRHIKKIKEVVRERHQSLNVDTIKEIREYYIYNPLGISNSINSGGAHSGVTISSDSIVFVHSGIFSEDNSMVLSHLHKAIRSYNQLKTMEDALLVYRLVRSSEKRLFNIDVGDISPVLAKQEVERIKNDYRTKMEYNPATGDLIDHRRHMTMIEDFFLPKRSDGRGSTIETLAGGSNLGEVDDVKLFKTNFFRSLGIPITRLESSTNTNISRAAEINREELNFSDFIQRLRLEFSVLFDELLKRQLILKKITTEEDWEYIKEFLYYDWRSTSYFSEIREIEMMKGRVELLEAIKPYIDDYFSKEYVRTEILRQSSEQIEQLKEQRRLEKEEELNSKKRKKDLIEPTDIPPEEPDSSLGEEPIEVSIEEPIEEPTDIPPEEPEEPEDLSNV